MGSKSSDESPTLSYKPSFPESQKSISMGRRRKLEWRSAAPHLVPGPEFCPSSLHEYHNSLLSPKKTSEAQMLSIRKHLLFLGWTIDCVVDKLTLRLRYTSPSGRCFYSLPKVCSTLLAQIPSPIARPEIAPKPVVVEPDYCPESVTEIPSPTPPMPEIAPKSVDETPPPGNFSLLCAPCDEYIVNPEYCPESVTDYCSVDGNPVATKAEKHLSAIGWSFYHYTPGSDGQKELRYCSPNGKTFDSLLSACKWCVDTPALTFTDLIGKINVNKKRKHDLNLILISNEIEQCPKKRGRKPKSKSKSQQQSTTTTKRVRDASTSSRTPRTVLSWLIDNDVVLPRARVVYRGKTGPPMAEGRITRKGIECNCCGSIFALSRFEAHAGSNNHRPSASIFLEDGRSLMDCQLQSLKTRDQKQTETEYVVQRQMEYDDEDKVNDDICSSCHYGGELVLCDQCPSAYHTLCLGLREVPDGDWFCPSCCCGICGSGRYDFHGKNVEDIVDCSVLTCTQCEHRYHAECLRIKGFTKCYPDGYWFCRDSCKRIFCGLRRILGKPIPVGTGSLTWTLLKHVKRDSCEQYSSDEECVLESYGKLNVALSVMHECFEPVKQIDTGRDMVEDVIFSKCSELNRMNFGGFYTVILEKNEELISAATVRIYGKRVAEVPLVATRFQYRRRGMCRILMTELEKKLVEFGVEKLVLPAVPTVIDTWTNSFGFSVMSEADRLKFLDCTFMDFQGTTMCQKVLVCNPSPVSSQASQGTRKKSRKRASKNGSLELDGTSPMSEVFQGEKMVVDQDSMCWIDELLMCG